MRQWYYPVQQYKSTDLVFDVVFYRPMVRTGEKGEYVRTYLPYVNYPIVGVRKGEKADTFDVMLNDGWICSGIPECDLDVYNVEQGNGWGVVHGEHYLANTWNGKAREDALEKGKPFYPFSSVVKYKGRFIPLVLGHVPTKPQRNDTWSQLQTASERARQYE